METAKIDNYVILPRYIATDYRGGKLSIPERNLFLWLRVNGSPYGIAIVDMTTYANETFNSPVDKSYINKLLLSLKSKRYIWYMERAGRRGSFDVHMGDWILPSKHLKTLDKHFGDIPVIGDRASEEASKTEVSIENSFLSQSLGMQKTVALSSESFKNVGKLIRGYDNDNNKEKENEKDSLQSLSLKKRDFSLGGFRESSYEELKCKEIASAIADADVSFCYGIYKKYGLTILERALTEFQKSDGLNKDNPPAFFNSIVKQFTNPY